MLTYGRLVSEEALLEFPQALELTQEHVRAHLSSIADADDDPTTNADDVSVTVYTLDDGHYYVYGSLDAEANAPYLKEGYDPDKEAEEGR